MANIVNEACPGGLCRTMRFLAGLNSSHFIAKRIVFGSGSSRVLSQPVVKIALTGVSLGIAVMVLSVMVMNGFRNEITGKVTGFGSHIRISKFDRNASLEEEPVVLDQGLIDSLRADADIGHVRLFANKAGIVKTNEAIQGVVLKGIDANDEPRFFEDKMRSGQPLRAAMPGNSYEALVSEGLASLLKLGLNDDLVVYFIAEPMRVRKFKIVGIYETGLEEFDRLFVFCDIGVIRKLNGWEQGQVGGVEVTLNDFDRLEASASKIYSQSGYGLKTETIRDLYPQVFNWLDLINVNVAIIILLMIAVAGMNMISTLLIIILDNTRLIGVLKSLGAANGMVRRLFLYVALYVIGAGMVLGNVIAYSLAAVQKQTGWIRLPQESYYVSVVPVDFSWMQVLWLNAGTLAVCGVMMLLPVMIVSGIRPVRVLRFD